MPGRYASSPYPFPTHTFSPTSLPSSPHPAFTAVSGSAIPRAPGGCPCPQKAQGLWSTTHPLPGAPCPPEWGNLLLPTNSKWVPQLDHTLGPPNTQKNVQLADSSLSLASSKLPGSFHYLSLSAYCSLRHPPLPTGFHFSSLTSSASLQSGIPHL